jgi:hypothetical protein
LGSDFLLVARARLGLLSQLLLELSHSFSFDEHAGVVFLVENRLLGLSAAADERARCGESDAQPECPDPRSQSHRLLPPVDYFGKFPTRTGD